MSYSFYIKNGEKIIIKNLSKEFCKEFSNEILDIINIIPFISWKESDLFNDNDFHKNKWKYCLYAKNINDEIIGILIAYFRRADDFHILDSIYIHKLAIRQDYQKLGIGTELIKYFIHKSFSEILWLWNITIQTNNNHLNRPVMNFYSKIGFINLYNIEYSNKTDTLMLYERTLFEKDSSKYKEGFKPKQLCHPRLNTIIDLDVVNISLPILYFSSTNNQKKEIVKFILNNYNFDVRFPSKILDLTEPQIENPIIEEEEKLVRFPLKLASRFINNVPYIIEDTMLFIKFFNRNGKRWELPGHDTKRWWKQLGSDGLLSIMGNTEQRRAVFVSQTGAYLKSNEYYLGRGELKGYIANESVKSVLNRSKGTYPYFFHSIFIPDGSDKTLSEMNMFEYAKYDYIRSSLLDLISKLEYSYDFHEIYTLLDL